MNLILLHEDEQRFYSFQSDLLENLKKRKIKDFSFKIRNLSKVANKFKNEILKEIKNIKISKKYNKIILQNSDKTNKFLIDLYLNNKKIDKYLLAFLLKLNSIYNGKYETQFLIRANLDNHRSEIYFKVLFYNYLLRVLYSNYGVYGDFKYFHSPKYIKKFLSFYHQNKKNFGNFYYDSGRILTGSEVVSDLFGRRKVEYKFINGKDYFYSLKNYKKKINTNKFLHYLSTCRFVDINKRQNNLFNEDDIILTDYYYQKIKETYIGTYKWANEYFLYKNTKSIFSKKQVKVIREYSPKLLKLQRLDIYFEYEGKKIAFEYQGEQHFKPIAFFGGKIALQKRKKLDIKKERICKKLNINLIKFNYNETISPQSIIKKLKENNIYI